MSTGNEIDDGETRRVRRSARISAKEVLRNDMAGKLQRPSKMIRYNF
jgi:hypothetical protein